MLVCSRKALPEPSVPPCAQAIRELVQKLCQSSHPLAKSMDYLQVGVLWDEFVRIDASCSTCSHGLRRTKSMITLIGVVGAASVGLPGIQTDQPWPRSTRHAHATHAQHEPHATS